MRVENFLANSTYDFFGKNIELTENKFNNFLVEYTFFEPRRITVTFNGEKVNPVNKMYWDETYYKYVPLLCSLLFKDKNLKTHKSRAVTKFTLNLLNSPLDKKINPFKNTFKNEFFRCVIPYNVNNKIWKDNCAIIKQTPYQSDDIDQYEFLLQKQNKLLIMSFIEEIDLYKSSV